MLSRLCDPQIHLWCNTCLLYRGQHGSLAFSIQVLADNEDTRIDNVERQKSVKYLSSVLQLIISLVSVLHDQGYSIIEFTSGLIK